MADTPTPGSNYSPEPWQQDARDRKTVLDASARLVAVTTSREDAARIVAGVNASRGLAAEGLTEAPLSDALQVLYEICLYHADMKFRNQIDRRGGFASLLERAEKAWKVFGDDAFKVEAPEPERGGRAAAGGAGADGGKPKETAGAPRPAETATAPRPAEAPRRPEARTKPQGPGDSSGK